MNIKFISTLTPEDENRVAPAVLRALAVFLDLLPIAYVVRIDTSDAHVYQHSKSNGSNGTMVPASETIQPQPTAFDS